MFNFIKNILKTFIVGRIINTSYYPNDISTTLTSYVFIIAITVGLIDSVLYGICFYLSIQTISKFHQQLVHPINATVGLLIRTQTDLYDLIKDLVQDNITDRVLIQNILNKVNTLEFIQKDSIMTIKKNINEDLRLFHTDFNNSVLPDSYIINRVYFYISTFSFLLYIHQLILWFSQYLTLKNPKKYLSYSFILSIIILSQSLGLIYFFHITNTFHLLFLLYIYTWISFIRNLICIYHQTFSDD